jgi:ELWxxDGT repeat protein
MVGGVSPTRLVAVGDRLFFTLGAGRDSQLWVTDGSPAGTIKLADAFFPSYPVDVGGTLYFTRSTTVWKSDGTVAGTVLLADFHPVSGQYVPNDLTPAGGRLFFAAKPRGGSDVSLWVSDGDGFTALRGLDSFAFNSLTAAADRIFFVSSDAEHGEELWTSDGTAAGTRLVRDIHPGPQGGSPSALSGGTGALRFRACDADACRLWESDGTEAGTRPLAELGDHAISTVVSAGDLAFFTVNEFAHGTELWAAPLSAAACIGDCDGDGGVTIAELVRLVGAALDQPNLEPCAVGGPAAVTIDRLVKAVGNALSGCRGFPPTVTPTMTPPATPTATSSPAT